MGIVNNLVNSNDTASPGLARKRLGTPKLNASSMGASIGSLANISNLGESQLNEKVITKNSKYKFQIEDLETIRTLGQGAGGQVMQVLHKPSGIEMARKIIKAVQTDENQDKVEKQILRELRILRKCVSPYIVTFYGAFMHSQDISIMMEFMDLGTLESIYLKNGPIPEKWVGKIASQTLQGLIYLYENHKIVHRDIKPANILVCSSGFAKLADFGVSKETAETLAMTFIGTQCFLAPERIKQGAPCTPRSDVWALGLTLMEISMARFPFPQEAMNTYFDMMQFITQESSPTLPEKVFSEDFREFCKACLIKDPEERPHPQSLMESEFIKRIESSDINLKEWTSSLKK